MNMRFKFKCEEEWSVVEMPPNMLLAHSDLKRSRRWNIFIFSALLAIFIALLFITYDPNEIKPNLFIMIGIAVSTALLIHNIRTKKHKVLELLTCIMIEGFEDYANSIINPLSQMLRHEFIKQTGLSSKKQKEIGKILVTAQRLKELSSECLNSEHQIKEDIEFLMEYIDELYGFEIKRMTYNEKQKGKKQSPGGHPTIDVRRSGRSR